MATVQDQWIPPMQRRSLSAGLVMGAIVGLWGPAALRAEAPAPAVTVDARSFAPVPAGEAVAVETNDDSDENLRMCDAVRLELAVRHRRVAIDGPLRLRVAADHVAADGLEPARAKDEQPTGGVRYRLRATLEERSSGRVLWQGEAIGSTRVGEVDEPLLGRELAAALVSRLARVVGRSS